MATNRNDLTVRVQGEDELSPLLSKLDSKIIRWVGAISASLAAIRITTDPVVAVARYERELANVAKTTNFTRSQINALSDDLLRLSKRMDVSVIDLAKVAAAAGQMGLGQEGAKGVAEFTESVSRMASVLDLTADEAGRNIAKIMNIFQVPIRNVEKAVSSFNQVANNSVATGEELLDVVRRIGNAAGSLRLDQTVGLAAAGLEFGQSPEVIGTSFVNIYARMSTKAEEIGKLLGIGAKDFVSILENDGIDAFTKILETLRTLDRTSQDQMITKLFGQGRIYSLVQKFVQDANNEVLNRTLANAKQGFTEGTSAIIEQQTVLETAQAQAVLLMNTIEGIRIKALNDDLSDSGNIMVKLTDYAMELREALSDPSMQSTISALAQGMFSLVESFVDAVKWVSSLNVNWENFIRLGQAWIGLKLATWLSRAAINATPLGKVLRDNSTAMEESVGSAKKLKKAMEEAEGVGQSPAVKAGWAARFLHLEEASKAYKTYSAEVQKQEALQRTAIQQTAAVEQARAKQAAATKASEQATGLVEGRSNRVQAARAAMLEAETKGNADIAAAQAAANTRYAAQEAKHLSNLTQIESVYQSEKARIRATGTRVGMTALERERQNQLAQANAQNERSLRSLDAYWNKRIATATAKATQEVQASQAILMTSYMSFDESLKNQGSKQSAAAPLGSIVAGAEAELNKTNLALAASTSRVAALTKVTTVAAIAFRGLVSVVTRAASLLMTGFVWATIIYSIADAMGWVDKLSRAWSGLTDALGFTSKAMRDAAVAQETERRALRKQQEEVDTLIEKYRELRSVRSGGEQMTGASADRLAAAIGGGENSEIREQAMRDSTQMVVGAMEQVKRYSEGAQKEMAARAEQAMAEVTRIREEIAKQEAKIRELQSIQPGPFRDDNTAEIFSALMDKEIAKLKENSKLLEEALGRAGTTAERLSGNLADSGRQADTARKDVEKLAISLATTFTPQSLTLFEDFALPLMRAEERAKDLQKEFMELQQQVSQATKELANSEGEGAEKAQARVEALETARVKLEDQNKEVQKLNTLLEDAQKKMLQTPGLPDAVRKSIIDVQGWLKTTLVEAEGLVAVFRMFPGLNFSGANAGLVQNKPTSGGNGAPTDPDRSAENEAKAAARARLKLAQETIKQEAALSEERSKQQLDADQRLYDQGLKSIEDFYAQRLRVQLEANQNEINFNNQELAQVRKEIAEASKESERLRYQADEVRLKGQNAVLLAQRDSIRAQIAEEERKAWESFNRDFTSRTQDLMAEQIIPEGTEQRFRYALANLEEEHKVFLARLRGSGSSVDSALADSMGLDFIRQAYQQAIKPLEDNLALAESGINRVTGELRLLQQDGTRTTQEIAASFTQSVNNAMPGMVAYVDEMQKLLDANTKLKTEAPEVWAAQQAAIDETRLRLAQLQQETDAVARGINTSITGSITSALASLELSAASFREVFGNLLLEIGNNIKQLFAQDISEGLMRSLGSTGEGGVGGFFQNILQSAGGAKADGSSASNALYVRQVGKQDAKDSLLGDVLEEGLGVSEEKSASFFSAFTDMLEGDFSGIGDMFSKLFGGLTDDLGGVFGNLLSGFSSLFSGGGGGGFFSSILGFFGMAHTGGRAGSFTMRRKVPLAAFSNAAYYHNGGIAGLKSNEVPAILERGETIRTEQQEKALSKRLADKGQGDINVWVVTPDQVSESGMGPQDVVMIVADNISRDGTIRKLIKTIPR